MKIRDIKNKTNEIFNESYQTIMKSFIATGGIVFLTTYVKEIVNPLLSLVILIATITLSHGYVTASLKAVNHRSDDIDVKKDGFVGFTRFKELFSTYFIYQVFLSIILFIFIIIGMLIILASLPDTYFVGVELLTMVLSIFTANTLDIGTVINVVGVISIIILFHGFIILFYAANFWLAPYVLEKYNISGVKAMSESFRLMKGYKRTYFLLCLSYIGWMLLEGIIIGILGRFLPIPFLVSAIGVFISMYLYKVKFEISLAVLYEEIDLARDTSGYQRSGEDSGHGV